MSSTQPDALDCKVEIRKYVLVSQPSRWGGQKGERTVVQSPVLKISKNVLEVPVKRYLGEQQNSVCFIPTDDIEKDSSSAYERNQVSKTPSWVDAHGVALFDSRDCDSLEYSQSDRFWIFIEANTGHNTERQVPVINLRTSKKGAIAIDQVCWYPNIQGPDGQLWTLGGAIRRQKIAGPGNFALWSWVIIQRLDGSQSVTKDVMIPPKGEKTGTIFHLSGQESRMLFEQRKKCMMGSPYFGKCDSPTASVSPSCSSPVSLLPTPPASPDTSHLAFLGKANKGKKTISLVSSSSGSTNPYGFLNRIMEMASQSKRSRGQGLRTSYIHPQQRSPCRFRRPRTSSIETEKSTLRKDISISDDMSYTFSSRDPTPSLRNSSNEPSPRLDLDDSDGTVLHIATLLHDFRRGNEPAYSVSEIAQKPTLIHDNWLSKPPNSNPKLIIRCNLKDPQCKYTALSTTPHFHVPPENCHHSKPILPRTFPLPDTCEYTLDHEHCVSRLCPLPAGAGQCLLANLPSKHHQCCYWDEAHLKGIPIYQKEIFKDYKVKEGRKNRVKIWDRSSDVDANGRVKKQDVLSRVPIWEGLGKGGMEILEWLEKGEADVDMGDLEGNRDPGRALLPPSGEEEMCWGRM
jgi:hypothetical protein